MLTSIGHSKKFKLAANYWNSPIVRIAVIALVYFATARFSLTFTINPAGIAAIWPPSGIFLSAVLLFRRNLRPYLVGVLLITDLIAELLAGTPLWVSVLYALALAGDAVFSSWLLLRFVGDPFTFRSHRDVLGFLLLSVVLSNSLMSMVAAAATVLIPGTSFWTAWVWWAASTGIGNLLLTPLILSWSDIWKFGLATWNLKKAVEEVIVLCFIALLNYFAFHFLTENNQFGLLLTYLNFPFLLWAALRLNIRGVTLTLIFLAWIAIHSVITGEIRTIPFSGTQIGAVLGIQLYLLVMAVPSLLLVAYATDRTQTEDSLRESETRYRSLFFDSPISLWEEDFSQIKRHLDQLRTQGVRDFDAFFDTHPEELLKYFRMANILDVNQAAMQLLDAESKEELYRNMVNLFTEDTLIAQKKSILAIAHGETTYDNEVTIRTITGRIIHVNLKWVIPKGYEGTYQKVFVSMVDITRRKKVENDLRDSEERFRQLAENIKDVFWVNEAKSGRVEYVSPAYERIWGKTTEDLYQDVSNWLKSIHPDDQDRVTRAFDDRAKIGSYDIEYRIVKPGDMIHWIHDRGFPVFDYAGHPARWVGVAEDITERKLAEEALRERNNFIEAILENAPIGFAVNRISDGIGTFVSRKFDAIYGVPRGSMNTVDEYFEQVYLDPAFREQMRARMLADMASGDPARMNWEDIPITTHTGESKVVTAINIPLLEQGLMISTVQDVTKRWRAEEEAHHETIRAEALARTAARLIAQLDFDTVLAIICEEAARALGAPAAFLFLYDPQQNIFSIAADFGFPTAYRGIHQAVPGAVYEKLISHYGAQGIILSMREMHHALGASPFHDNPLCAILAVNLLQGIERIGILCVAPNCEASKYSKEDLELIQGIANQAAQAITRARLFEQVSTGQKHLKNLSKRLLEVQELERRALALELHDELGQLLNSAKMSLDMIAILPPQAAEEHLHRAQNLVSDLVERVREMSLQLRPSMLDDMGLLPALSWLFKNYQLQTGKNVVFKQAHLDQRFPPQVEITAYRIIQEALTNVIRHAGDDKQVRVEVWIDDRALNIQVRDRGKGFLPAEALGEYESSGLSGMRERARLLGGELIVESAPGAGTTLSASLPFGMPLSNMG